MPQCQALICWNNLKRGGFEKVKTEWQGWWLLRWECWWWWWCGQRAWQHWRWERGQQGLKCPHLSHCIILVHSNVSYRTLLHYDVSHFTLSVVSLPMFRCPRPCHSLSQSYMMSPTVSKIYMTGSRIQETLFLVRKERLTFRLWLCVGGKKNLLDLRWVGGWSLGSLLFSQIKWFSV